MITVLAGGVGAARFLEGLVTVAEEDISIIVNTGDDIEIYGLHISPDIDIIIYTLANMVDKEKGWGIKGDTYNCLIELQKYGYETWFKLGDKDLSTHIFRTMLLQKGLKLSEITNIERKAFGLRQNILPMTDDKVETSITTKNGRMHFQEYMVKRGTQDEVLQVNYKGIDSARPAPGVIESIMQAEKIILCPSNPIVSIGTILSVKGVRDSLRVTKSKIIGISPLIAGKTVKGPADKLMKGLGIEVSAWGVAKLYSDFLDYFVIDEVDKNLKERIRSLGVKVFVTNTIMKNIEEKIDLANFILKVM